MHVYLCLFPQPHLHKIVNSSMELAQSAKEPYNYFLLLRALFRSIGGGSHDLLYQEFLPLLPNLLQGKTAQNCSIFQKYSERCNLTNFSFSLHRSEHVAKWPSQAAYEGSLCRVVSNCASASQFLVALLTYAYGSIGECPQWLSDLGQPGSSYPGAVCGQPPA